MLGQPLETAPISLELATPIAWVTVSLVTSGEVTKLTVTHQIGVANSKLIAAVSNGWPSILASLKSLIETGRALA